jgi:hypothetical protein
MNSSTPAYRRPLITIAALAVAVAAPAGASTLSVIYKPTDESGPTTLLNTVPVPGGIITGTHEGGGQSGGDLFLLTPGKKNKPYTRTTIYTFQGANFPTTGAMPSANLIRDKHGNIWGTTDGNGANGTGTLYELVAPATKGGAYSFRLVMQMPAAFYHGLAGAGFDQLVFDAKGDLFGLLRGSLTGNALGAIFEVSAAQLASGAGAPSLLYTFPASDDSYPYGLARDSHGNFFGIDPQGGSVPLADYYAGAVWEVSPPATKGGAYSRQNIHDFCTAVNSGGYCIDGWLPMGGVAVSASGTVYGTTFYEGVDPANMAGNGTIWSAQPPAAGSNAWTFTTLHVLDGENQDGTQSTDGDVRFPINRPLLTSAGQIVFTPTYGAYFNGSPANGAVVEISETTGYATVINSDFAAYNVTAGPVTNSTGLSQDSAGNFYGATNAYYALSGCSGTCTYGVIFKVTP